MEKYVDYKLCEECGGACCKQGGCIYMPKDFDYLNFNALKSILEEGNISISGQPFNGFHNNAWSFMLYLRARNENGPIVDLITAGSPCKLLGERGCTLKEIERPTLGLLVNPIKIGGPCKKEYTTRYAMGWLKYNEVLTRLVKYYTNRNVPEIISEQLNVELLKINKKIDNNEPLSEMEKIIIVWYKEIMCNRPYYSPKEIKEKKFVLKY